MTLILHFTTHDIRLEDARGRIDFLGDILTLFDTYFIFYILLLYTHTRHRLEDARGRIDFLGDILTLFDTHDTTHDTHTEFIFFKKKNYDTVPTP